MNPFSEANILDSWQRNATPWIIAVRERQIESRRMVTDAAIVEAVLATAPGSVLDMGCGEGWLARALAAEGVAVIGVDATPELIAHARQAGGGDFRVMSYEQIAAGELEVRVDALVCNFSLLGDSSTRDLFRAFRSLLTPRGRVLVQTLHPLSVCGERTCQDGWIEGSWAGFSADFSDPAPWYFRTLGSWVGLFAEHGLHLLELHEPLHPHTRKPLSALFVAEPR
ncbi:MAG TPA: class I SAM-dependent methyltransferase [Rhodanobacter sp.]|nr:class I SAM-dependent methyltransferase [Rhodanobacter sp.]